MNQWVRPRQAGTRHNKRIPSGIAEPVTSSVSGLLGEQAHGQGRRRFMYPTGSPDVGSSWRNCMFTPEETQNLTRATAHDQAGQKIDQVAIVYRDQATGEPEWLTVMTGPFGMKETFVPLPRGRARTRSLANLAIAPVARPTEEVS